MSHNWTIDDAARVMSNAHGLIRQAIFNQKSPYEALAYLHYFLGWDLDDIGNPVDIDELLAQFPDSPRVPFQQVVTLEYLSGDFDGYLYPDGQPNAMYVRWQSPYGWVLLTVYLPVQDGWGTDQKIMASMSPSDYERTLDMAYHYNAN